MRPYLAILKDSVREQMVSRLLWIVLLLITMVLIVILPIGVYELPSGHLQSEDIKEERALAIKLQAAGNSETPSPGKHVWGLLKDDVKDQIKELPTEKSQRLPSLLSLVFRQNLDELLSREDFYDEASWQSIPKDQKFDDLYARRHDTDDTLALARLNRAALASAFPDEVTPAKASLPVFYYFTHSWSTMALSHAGSPDGKSAANPFEGVRAATALQSILTLLIDWFLGTVGIFVGILVTASIIPNMFEAGSIDLLFSKPVGRVMVFLTKFVGGCSFVLLSSGFFFLGLWLIFGLRMGFWADKLLLCIPLYLFLFSIYYCVSAVVGVIYRNAIISVVVTILFWVLCFSVKFSNGIVEGFLLPRHLRSCAVIEDQYFATDESGRLLKWKSGEWRPIIAAQITSGPRQGAFFGGLILGPSADPTNKQLVALQAQPILQNIYGTALILAKADDEWQAHLVDGLPNNTSDYLVEAGGPLMVTSTGVYRYNGDVKTKGAGSLKALGGLVGLPSNKTIPKFQLVSDVYDLSLPVAAAINPSSGEIAVTSQRQLLLLARDDQGQWKLKAKTASPSPQPGLLVFSGDTLALATVEGRVFFLSPKDLSVQKELTTPSHEAVRQADISADGRFIALVLRDRTLWLYDAKQQEKIRWWFHGQGDINAARFSPKGLAVVDQINRLRLYELETWKQLDEVKPDADWLEKTSRFAISPLHAALPQPGELDTLTSYLLADEESRPKLTSMSHDPRGTTVPVDIWAPVRSSLIFMAVVLGIGCVYIHRKDF